MPEIIQEQLQSAMDFSYTENQKMVAEIVRNFLAREYPPNRMMQDDEEQRFPLDVVMKAGELGLLGMIFPNEIGGAGFGYLEYVVAIEELAKYDPSLALTIAAHNSLGTNHIYQFGSEEQKRKYVPSLASGKKLAAWALTEPNSGSDAAGMLTTAVRDGDHWVLNGTKNFITNSHSAEIAVVMAITDREKGHHGISAFIIEKGTPGFSAGKKRKQARHARLWNRAVGDG